MRRGAGAGEPGMGSPSAYSPAATGVLSMSNLADLLNDTFQASNDSIKIFGDIIGAAADLSGAFGFVSLGLQLLGIGQANMEAIQALISRDFALLGKRLEADQILQRNTTLNGYIAPALTQLELLQAEVDAHPRPTEIVEFSQPCVTAF